MRRKIKLTSAEDMLKRLYEKNPLTPEERAEVDASVAAHMQELRLTIAIEEARKAKGLTQAELGRLAGFDQSEISKFENSNSNPTLQTLCRIGAALDLELTFQPLTATSARATKLEPNTTTFLARSGHFQTNPAPLNRSIPWQKSTQ
jgi:transcriptional regulator with XRE-family HTH domain